MLDLYNFLFCLPSKIFQSKFKLTVFVYEDPDLPESIFTAKESPLVKELVNVLLI